MTKKQDKQKRKRFFPLNYPFNGILERYHTSKFLLPNSIRACNAKPAKLDTITDYGRPMKPFFIEIQNFWAELSAPILIQ